MGDFHSEYKYFKGSLPPSILSQRTLLSKGGDLNPVVRVKLPIASKLPLPNKEASLSQSTILSKKKMLDTHKILNQKTILDDMTVLKSGPSVRKDVKNEVKNEDSDTDEDEPGPQIKSEDTDQPEDTTKGEEKVDPETKYNAKEDFEKIVKGEEELEAIREKIRKHELQGEFKNKLQSLKYEYYKGVKEENETLDPDLRESEDYLWMYAETMAKYQLALEQHRHTTKKGKKGAKKEEIKKAPAPQTPSPKKQLFPPDTGYSQSSEADAQAAEVAALSGEWGDFDGGSTFFSPIKDVLQGNVPHQHRLLQIVPVLLAVLLEELGLSGGVRLELD